MPVFVWSKLHILFLFGFNCVQEATSCGLKNPVFEKSSVLHTRTCGAADLPNGLGNVLPLQHLALELSCKCFSR